MKRLRDAGRITDALEYADRDTCPELRASLLVDLARISVSGMDAESSQNQKDTVIKQAQEAIELVKGYNSDTNPTFSGNQVSRIKKIWWVLPIDRMSSYMLIICSPMLIVMSQSWQVPPPIR